MIASHHWSSAKEPVCECRKSRMMFACSVNVLLQIVGRLGEAVLCWLAQYITELTADFFLPFHVLLNSDPPKKKKKKEDKGANLILKVGRNICKKIDMLFSFW